MLKKKIKALRWSYRLKRLERRCQGILTALEAALAAAPGVTPVLIISYNNGQYVENTVAQLAARGIRPIVIDNRSSDDVSIAILKRLHSEQSAWVIFSPENFGHMVGFMDPIYRALPDVFAYTDPDLQFSATLPTDFMRVLTDLTHQYRVYKAGFALDVSDTAQLSNVGFTLSQYRPLLIEKPYTVQSWESQYWRMKLDHPGLELYAAKIDTTFAVYNKAHYQGDFFEALRVAGDYSALHLPWFPAKDLMSPEQKARYLQHNKSTNWVQ
jgi:hypothetical protein